MPRTGKLEYERRLIKVQDWIIMGHPPATIIREIITLEWCASNRHAERMLKQAREKWLVGLEDDVAKKRQLKVVELQQLKATMKDYYRGTPEGMKALLAVEKAIISLEGLNQPNRHILQGDEQKPVMVEVKSNVDYTKLSDEALEEIVRARKDKPEDA